MPTAPNPGTTGSPYPIDLSKVVKKLMNPGQDSVMTHYTSAFVMMDGSVKMGGHQNTGHLGIGDGQSGIYMPPMSPAFDGEDIRPIKDIYTNYYSSHIITESGDLWGFGYSGHGQVGDGAAVSRSYPRPAAWGSFDKPVLIKMVSTCDSFASHANSYYALDTQGNLWTWGYNGYGQLGLGNTSTTYFHPYKASLTNIVQMAATGGEWGSAYAVDAAGAAFSCGYGTIGQLGLTNAHYNAWTQVNLPGACISVKPSSDWNGTYSYGHALWLLDDGRVFAAGYNGYGQLGDNTQGSNYGSPKHIASLNNIVKIWAGGGEYGYSFALDADGNLFGWGLNDYGRLGLGAAKNGARVLQPAQITLPAGVGVPVKMALAGYNNYSTAAILTDQGYVVAAGYNGWYQCGANHSGHLLSFEKMSLPPGVQGNVVDVRPVGHESLSGFSILDKDGIAWAVGSNRNHQLCVSDSMRDAIAIAQRVVF